MAQTTIARNKQEALEKRLAALGIRTEDLTEQFIRAGGKGGQKLNKTSSAVYLRHGPSGIEVKVQKSRSQSVNRYFARRYLADRFEEEVLGRKSRAQQKREQVRKQKDRRRRRGPSSKEEDSS